MLSGHVVAITSILLFPVKVGSVTISLKKIKGHSAYQRELVQSLLETIRVIIRLNNRYYFPIVDFL